MRDVLARDNAPEACRQAVGAEVFLDPAGTGRCGEGVGRADGVEAVQQGGGAGLQRRMAVADMLGHGGVKLLEREGFAEILPHLHFAVLAMTADEAEELFVRERHVMALGGGHVGLENKRL